MLVAALRFSVVTSVAVFLAVPALAAPVTFDQDHPLFRLLTAAPQKRFAVAAELVLAPESASTEEIRDLVSKAPFKYLFRASKTAQAALDFVLLKRSGGVVPALAIGAEKSGPNLLLLAVDGLRSDYVGAYGHPRPTTPRLDALARDGALFVAAVSTSSWSLPGHASLLTSLYPSAHGLESREELASMRLSREVTTLAEAFQNAGFDTAGLATDALLDPRPGFDRGFDVYVRRAGTVVEQTARARLWLEWHVYHVARGLEPGRFLLFVQIDGSSSSAAMPAPYAAMFPALADSDQARAIAAYEAQTRWVDDQIGILIDALSGLGLGDATAVVVTASHGTELGERGAYGAGNSLHAEQLRVPLIVRFPGRVEPGQRIAGTVSLLDVLPTALTWAELAPVASAQGMDLTPYVRRPGHEDLPPPLPQRDLVAELGPAERDWERPFHIRALRSGDRKLIVHRATDGAKQKTMFDLAADPSEKHDLMQNADANLTAVAVVLEQKLRTHMLAAAAPTPLPTAAAADHGHAH